MMRNLLRYMIRGLFYTVPIGITVYLIIVSIQFLDALIPVEVPGMGFLIILAGLVIVGYLGSVILSSSVGKVVKRLEKVVLRLPLVRIVYTAIKDLVSALMGTTSTFDQAVVVTLDKVNDIRKIGFVTKTDLTDLGIEEGMVSVYFPYSYGIMGDLRIVPSDRVKALKGKSSAEVMKFIVSGGVVQLEDKEE